MDRLVVLAVARVRAKPQQAVCRERELGSRIQSACLQIAGSTPQGLAKLTKHAFAIMIYDDQLRLVVGLATSPLCPADESQDLQALSLRLSSTVCLDASAPTYLVQGCNRSRVIEPPACKSLRAYLEDKQHG